jgi:putative hemolysin
VKGFKEMNKKIIVVLCCLLLAGCAQVTPQPSPVVVPPTSTPQAESADMPNPASVYCEEQGYKSEIRTAADGSQSGVCIFPDGSECDEWAYYRGECAPASQIATEPAPTEIPGVSPIDPAEYDGWWTYTHAVYGFSLLLPPDWVVDEVSANEQILSGHLLNIHPQDRAGKLNIRMTFRRVGEQDILLWPTGVGSGEFLPQGTLEVAGGNVRRTYFVCPTGQVNSIWYQGEQQANIQRGDLEFGFIYSYTDVYCQEGYSLGGKTERVGDLVVASLSVP